MDRQALVYVDLNGVPYLVGRLWTRVRKGKDGATFEYDASWLEHRERFSLEPALKLGPGPFHTPADMPMFGAIGDSAPDRWGRALMRRMERRRAEREKQTPRTLLEIDYLLQVDDEAPSDQGRAPVPHPRVTAFSVVTSGRPVKSSPSVNALLVGRRRRSLRRRWDRRCDGGPPADMGTAAG